MSYHVTSLIRLLLAACVCRSNLGNKRTRFTHYQHRMAHTLRHFCSFSSIGTDTRCCSTPCRFVLGITLVCENCRNRPMYLRCYCPPVLGGHCDTVAMLATTGTLVPQRSAVRLLAERRRGLCRCRPACLSNVIVAILSSRWSTSDERSLPFGRDDMVRTPPLLVNRY